MSSKNSFPAILSIGSYLPRWRLPRSLAAGANTWMVPGLSARAEGSRAFAHWDEDSNTLAVEAARLCLDGQHQPAPGLISLASTSLPFTDRSNAGIVREALNLPQAVAQRELAGNRRAASSALLNALQTFADADATELLIASDCIDALPASQAEMEQGHGASAVLLGKADSDNAQLARLMAGASLNEDFVDHYRSTERAFDYQLESRWIRDAHSRPLLARLLPQVLEQAGVEPTQVDFLLAPLTPPERRQLAREHGFDNASMLDELEQKAGLCGTAHPLLQLHLALEQASKGQIILLLGMGQGFDALLLRRGERAPAQNLARMLDQGQQEDSYTRYLGLRGLLDMELGLRAERDNRTSLAAFGRRHRDLTGFLGGRCQQCQGLQFPASRYCVHCQAEGEQVQESLAGLTGTVNSYTEDWLAYTPRPPLIFGNVHFPGQANVMMEFTDFQPGELQTGMGVRMAFRIKDMDEKRGYRRYFWKPAPARTNGADNG